jgi:hypothetical protein
MQPNTNRNGLIPSLNAPLCFTILRVPGGTLGLVEAEWSGDDG